MRDVQEITEDEMILAFIRSEADAPRWAERYRGSGLQADDAGPNANPDDAAQNQRRRTALAVARGFGHDAALFKGVPSDVSWLRGVVTVDELGGFRHLKYPTFLQLTGGSRLVRDGADSTVTVRAEGLSEAISDLAQAVSQGQRHPPLIGVAEDFEAVPVILEGNKRASAYVRALSPDEQIEVIVGVSPAVGTMIFF
jgi:hypothetical protein